MKKKIKNVFLTGIAAIIPLSVTLYVFFFILRITKKLVSFIPHRFQPDYLLQIHIPGLEIIIALVFIFIIGLITKSYIGNKIVQLGELVLDKIPLLSGLYKAVKQLVDAIFSEKHESFKKVVLIEYPRRGLYSIAFVTGIAKGEVQTKTEHHCVNLFVPTTPNPTSGFYIMAPESDVIKLSMTVEEAFRLIISGGIISPPEKMGKIEKKGDNRADNI